MVVALPRRHCSTARLANLGLSCRAFISSQCVLWSKTAEEAATALASANAAVSFTRSLTHSDRACCWLHFSHFSSTKEEEEEDRANEVKK